MTRDLDVYRIDNVIKKANKSAVAQQRESERRPALRSDRTSGGSISNTLTPLLPGNERSDLRRGQ